MSASTRLPAESTGPSSSHGSGERHGQLPRFRAMAFPRKRAVTACETCRLKKTKCGNQRPVCASCAKHNWPCSYDPRNGHSSFDPASLLILEKLDETLQKLNELSRGVRAHDAQIHVNSLSEDSTATSRSQNLGQVMLSNDASHPCSSDCLEVLTAFASAECILSWPIFDGKWPSNTLSQETPTGDLTATHSNDEDSLQRSKRSKQGINEENVPVLVERFLELVHSKNPVFHTRQIREAARKIAEEGTSWDASSCIVLLACALGAIARPFNPSCEAGLLRGRNSVEETSEQRETAEVYYQAARKRLGLLNPGILAGQCHMLSGIYLMYTLRPLQGWSAFHQAGSVHTLYLTSQAALQQRNGDSAATLKQSERSLEQRLYWTVLKSECELREQIDLPQSGLCKLGYPYLFPSPPNPCSPAQSPQNQFHTQTPSSTTTPLSQIISSTASTSAFQRSEEQTWFYYLSEIALRRIENRVLNTFYKEDHHHWSQVELETMINAAEEVEAQLEDSYSSLPEVIRFDDLDSGQALDELRYMTQARSICIRSLLYRPFLYYAVHDSYRVRTHNTNTVLQSLLQKSLNICLACNTGGAMTHRHHGTWFGLRETFTTGSMLIAAKLSGLITTTSLTDDGEVHENQYGHALRTGIEKLSYWEAESPPDIARAREVLEGLIANSN